MIFRSRLPVLIWDPSVSITNGIPTCLDRRMKYSRSARLECDMLTRTKSTPLSFIFLRSRSLLVDGPRVTIIFAFRWIITVILSSILSTLHDDELLIGQEFPVELWRNTLRTPRIGERLAGDGNELPLIAVWIQGQLQKAIWVIVPDDTVWGGA